MLLSLAGIAALAVAGGGGQVAALFGVLFALGAMSHVLFLMISLVVTALRPGLRQTDEFHRTAARNAAALIVRTAEMGPWTTHPPTVPSDHLVFLERQYNTSTPSGDGLIRASQ